MKEMNKETKADYIRNVDPEDINEYIRTLPFELTADQDEAIKDIYKDMTSSRRMNRLLQGDVGSGKTIVSVVAAYINFLSKHQTALMAPTEVLAYQHYETIKHLRCDNILLMVDDIFMRDYVNPIVVQVVCDMVGGVVGAFNFEKSFDINDIPISDFVCIRNPKGKYKTSSSPGEQDCHAQLCRLETAQTI